METFFQQIYNLFLILLLGIDIIDWISFTIVIIFQTLIFSVGINFNKRLINYSAITVYLGMITFFLTVLLQDVKFTSIAFINILDLTHFLDKNNIGQIITITGTILAFFSIIILSFGDFSRYVKSERDLKKGNLSLILNIIISLKFIPLEIPVPRAFENASFAANLLA